MTRLGDSGALVMHLALSPDGRWLASGGDDHLLTLWGVHGRSPRVFRGHDAPIIAVAFASDGSFVVSCDMGGGVRLWDLSSGEGREIGRHEGAALGVAIAPDGRHIASVGTDGVRVFDRRARSARLLGATAGAQAIAYSPDGAFLAAAGMDHEVHLWTTATDEHRALSGHQRPIYAVGFSPDSSRLASVSYDRTVRVWDPRPATATRCAATARRSTPSISHRSDRA